MRKGQSYVIITDESHPKHELVKALLNKGFSDFELAYATHWASDSGWVVTRGGRGLPTWLGFTKSEALKKIERIKKD